MFTSFNLKTRVTVIDVIRVLKIIPHKQSLVRIMFYSMKTFFHKGETVLMRIVKLVPCHASLCTHYVGKKRLESSLKPLIIRKSGSQIAHCNCVKCFTKHHACYRIDKSITLILQDRVGCHPHIAVDPGFLPHPHIIIILSLVCRRFPLEIFIFGIKTLELSIFLRTRACHIKTAVLCAEKIPTMQVIDIPVSVIVPAIDTFSWIGPKSGGQIYGSGINTRIDNTYHNSSRRLNIAGFQKSDCFKQIYSM